MASQSSQFGDEYVDLLADKPPDPLEDTPVEPKEQPTVLKEGRTEEKGKHELN